MDAPVFSSFLTLLAMSCVSLALSVIFYLKARDLAKVSRKLSPSIFSKTFNVFDPYPSRNKLLRSFLTVLPLFVIVSAGFFFVVSIKLVESGLLLSLIILIVCLNLIVVEETPEFYSNTTVFIKAINAGTGLGHGDVKVFELIKKTLPKLSIYYLALTIIFVLSAMTLSSILSSTFLVSTKFFNIVFEYSSPAGIFAPYVILVPLVLITVLVQILGKKVKGRIFHVNF